MKVFSLIVDRFFQWISQTGFGGAFLGTECKPSHRNFFCLCGKYMCTFPITIFSCHHIFLIVSDYCIHDSDFPELCFRNKLYRTPRARQAILTRGPPPQPPRCITQSVIFLKPQILTGSAVKLLGIEYSLIFQAFHPIGGGDVWS